MPRAGPLLVAAGATALLACVPAGAQAVSSATLRLDNDILALRGNGPPPDYDYTHGLELSLELGEPGRLRRWLGATPPCGGAAAVRACAYHEIGIGQKIFTPRRDAPDPMPGERPYAAWLYLYSRSTRVEPGRVRSFGAAVGVTGRPALGEPVQNGVHRLLGSRRQEGWGHQLAYEPALVYRYTDGFPRRRSLPGLGIATLTPGWEAAAGNVRTAAGATASVGLARSTGRGAHVLAGARGEWVLRDLFLDGNTFRHNSTAERIPLVAEVEVGAGYRAGHWALEYRHAVRSREYRAQPDPHPYGSLVLTRAR